MYRLTKIDGATSSHIGCLCKVKGKEAKIGEDYGLPNLLMIQVRMTVKESEEWDKKLYEVALLCEDGYERDLGLKAVLRTDDGGLKLYGHSTIYYLEKEE